MTNDNKNNYNITVAIITVTIITPRGVCPLSLPPPSQGAFWWHSALQTATKALKGVF